MGINTWIHKTGEQGNIISIDTVTMKGDINQHLHIIQNRRTREVIQYNLHPHHYTNRRTGKIIQNKQTREVNVDTVMQCT